GQRTGRGGVRLAADLPVPPEVQRTDHRGPVRGDQASRPCGFPPRPSRGGAQAARATRHLPPAMECDMGTKSPGRTLPNAALMASPYVGEALVQVGAATGSAAVAAGVGIGAAALGARTVMRRRESPGQRARRELRQASRKATVTRTTA